VLRAATIAAGKKKQSARDAFHMVVMPRYGIERVFSFDGDYDRWPGLEQIWKTRG
jgi:predicted nucleic acid-binding protein